MLPGEQRSTERGEDADGHPAVLRGYADVIAWLNAGWSRPPGWLSRRPGSSWTIEKRRFPGAFEGNIPLADIKARYGFTNDDIKAIDLLLHPSENRRSRRPDPVADHLI